MAGFGKMALPLVIEVPVGIGIEGTGGELTTNEHIGIGVGEGELTAIAASLSGVGTSWTNAPSISIACSSPCTSLCLPNLRQERCARCALVDCIDRSVPALCLGLSFAP